MDVSEIPTPALLLDLPRLQRNIHAMAERSKNLGVTLRPHIKTHKSIDIARLQRDSGATGITVATLKEAEIFAQAGFSDITHAFPLAGNKIPQVMSLQDSADVAVTVDHLAPANLLAEAATRAGRTIGIWLKVDCGYHRAGVDPRSDRAVDMARFLSDSPALDFRGILTHAGHSYKANDKPELQVIAQQERDVMVAFRQRLEKKGITAPKVSIGSTPSISAVDHLQGIDEIRPGNYVFYDYTQILLGSCTPEQPAVTVVATVVSHQPGADHVVIDAGTLALSHDPGPTHLDPLAGRGRVLLGMKSMELHPSLRVRVVSQEHGIVQGNSADDLASLTSGARLRILPNHSCLTAALFDRYTVVVNGQVTDSWTISRQR